MTIEFLDNLDRKLFDGKRGDFSPIVGQMAVYSLCIALAMGICIVITQFAVDGMETQQNIVSIISIIGFLAMLILLVKQMLPLWKSTISTSGKVIYTLFVGGISFVCWLLGILLVYLVVILFALWLGLKIWSLTSRSGSSSSNYHASKENNGPAKYKLDDGTIVTEDSFGSGFHGNDYHNYERNSDGTFSRTD